MNYDDKDIIIVDDNEMMLKIAKKVLQKYNFNKIDTYLNAADTLDAINNHNYQLIIADDMMPGVSGIEMLKELKKNPKFNTPIVVLTGNVEIPNPKEFYLNVGFDDFLEKPINLSELDRVLKKFL